jgi:hypothetical protein
VLPAHEAQRNKREYSFERGQSMEILPHSTHGLSCWCYISAWCAE